MAEIVFVTIPQETVNDVSVRLLSWKVPSGTVVEKDQVLCEVETSKAVMEIEAPAAGQVVYSAEPDSEIPVGETICQIVPEGMSPLSFAAPVPEAKSASHNIPVTVPNGVPGAALIPDEAASESSISESDLRPARFTPLAAKMAAEFGFDKGSFPRGSLVRRDDVLRRAGKLPPVQAAGPTATSSAKTSGGAVESAENAPVAGVAIEWSELPRKKIFEGRVLGQGHAKTIQSSVTCSVRIHKLRGQLQSLGLTSIGLSALVIFETARLLRKYPVFNAVHDRGRMGQYGSINIGWALDGGEGLVVPVVASADEKTPQEIVETMQRQVEGYVGGTLSTTDFLGGTFTVSDLSNDGISHFHPLISQGQSAILGIGSEFEAGGNETLILILAFDHQLAEGRKAAQFVRDLATRLEAHGAPVPPSEVQPEPRAADEPYCALCMRSGTTLLKLNEALVKSEVPPGFVCSYCLAGIK
jgi:pyruvate/2-oxoglutarate dehydrogenase complex dihydrolipoamide acyltransferase (E2) component